jgi:hypothetical protein
VQATSLLRIEDTTKCSPIARGSGFGNSTGSAAEVNPKAGFGFKASATFPVLKTSDIGGISGSREAIDVSFGNKPWR